MWGKEGVRYGNETVKSFENRLKRIPGFREQLIINKFDDATDDTIYISDDQSVDIMYLPYMEQEM